MVHFKGQARQADLLNYTKVMGLQGYSVDLINAWKVPCLGDHHAGDQAGRRHAWTPPPVAGPQ